MEKVILKCLKTFYHKQSINTAFNGCMVFKKNKYIYIDIGNPLQC